MSNIWMGLSALAVAVTVASAGFAEQYEQLVAGSDDFQAHRKIFAQKAGELIESGRCTGADIKEWGGWMRSTTKGNNVYFLFCGGDTVNNRIYLDARTGQLFR